MKLTSLRLVIGLALPVWALGCTQSTTSEDVAKARQKVQTEQQDVQQARAQTEKNVAKEEQKLDTTRREAMKPVLDEEKDVANAQRKGAEKIQAEQQDVTKADQKLNQTEKEYAATQARDAFAQQGDQKLAAADEKIKQLKDKAAIEQGAAKDATQRQIDEIQTHRDHLHDALAKMRHEELAKWKDYQSDAQLAMKQIDQAMAAALKGVRS